MNPMNDEPRQTDTSETTNRPSADRITASAVKARQPVTTVRKLGSGRVANPHGKQDATPLREAAMSSSAPGALDHGDLAVRFEARFRDFAHRAQAMGAQRAIEGLLRNVVLAQRPGVLQAIAGKQ